MGCSCIELAARGREREEAIRLMRTRGLNKYVFVAILVNYCIIDHVTFT